MFKRLNSDALPIRFTFNGQEIIGQPGDTIATALLASGYRVLGSNPSSGKVRGSFCLMGSCFECMVDVDEVSVQACQIVISEGLEVKLLTPPATFSGETS